MPDQATTPTPKFKSPPVVETVIGVQFPELADFRMGHFGLYGNTIPDYELGDDKVRLPEIIERFPPLPAITQSQLLLASGPPPQRVWYTAKSGSELIQLQPDRFLFNWQRRGEDDSYPGYATSCPKFLAQFDNFRDFCTKNNLEKPRPNLCEVTYLNHIKPLDGESAIDLFGLVFEGLSWKNPNAGLPRPENVTFNRVYVIEHENQKVGRLYAEATIAFQQDDKERRGFVLLKMTGRVNLQTDDADGLVWALQIAHEQVVCGFAEITNRQIQNDRWERIR